MLRRARALGASRKIYMQSAVPPGSLPDAVRQHALAHPESPALQIYSAEASERSTISYGSLADEITSARRWLQENLNFLAQSPPRQHQQLRVAFLSHNSATYLVHVLACMDLCAIVVALNWRTPAAALGEQAAALGCVLLLASPAMESEGREAAACAPSTRFELLPRSHHSPRDAATAAATAAAAAASEALRQSDDSVAVVFFTSGSTGKPKAIPHTHSALLWWARQYTDALPTVFDKARLPRDQWGSLSFSPYFHVMGFVANTVLNLVQGAPAYVLAQPTRTLDAHLVVEAALCLQPRAINTVPVIVEGLCALLEAGDSDTARALSRVGLLTYGGAALPSYCASILRAAGIATACTYGQTETAGPVMLGFIGGDLNALRPFGGGAVSFELKPDPRDNDPRDTGDAEGAAAAKGQQAAAAEAGVLVFSGLECVSRMRFADGGELTRVLAQTAAYETRDNFRVVEGPSSRQSGRWLLYDCREDDVLVHTSGEMTNPLPTEDIFKSMSVSDVSRVCMLGNNRARPAMLVELTEGADLRTAGLGLCSVLEAANAQLAEYSQLRIDDVWLLQPPHAAPLATSIKGNVVRSFAEARLHSLEAGRGGAIRLSVTAPWGDLVCNDDGSALDSMAVAAAASSSSRSSSVALAESREAAVMGHAMLLLSYCVVSVHYVIHGRHVTVFAEQQSTPHWLYLAMRFPAHSWAMPLAFMLVAVTDSVRLSSAIRARGDVAATAKEFAYMQIVRPWMQLVAFKMALTFADAQNWGLHSGAWPPMWFLFTLLIMRILRLFAWLARIPEAAVVALSVAVLLASGSPDTPLSYLRRCLQATPEPTGVADLLSFVPLSTEFHGRVTFRLFSKTLVYPQCAGSFPQLRSGTASDFLFSHLVLPYMQAADPLHMRTMEYWPYYCAGPWLLARALHSRKVAPHASTRSAKVRLLVLAVVVVSSYLAVRDAWRKSITGSGDYSVCENWLALSQAKPTQQVESELFTVSSTYSSTCCHAESAAFTIAEFTESKVLRVFCIVAPAVALATHRGMWQAAVERTVLIALAVLPFAFGVGRIPFMPHASFEELQHAVLGEAARLVSVCATCVAYVELLPDTPSTLSRVRAIACLE